MTLREELLRRIEKKKREIALMENKVKEAEVYISALEETLTIVPRDDGEAPDPANMNPALREGSSIAKAREALQRAARPLHIKDLLLAMGRPTDKDSRAALAGSLGSYARKNEIFVRTGPNIFGLLEMRNGSGSESALAIKTQPPPNFGIDDSPGDGGITDDDVPF